MLCFVRLIYFLREVRMSQELSTRAVREIVEGVVRVAGELASNSTASAQDRVAAALAGVDMTPEARSRLKVWVGSPTFHIDEKRIRATARGAYDWALTDTNTYLSQQGISPMQHVGTIQPWVS